MDKNEFKDIMSKRETRVYYLEHDFFAWCIYYFSKSFHYSKVAPFHRYRCKIVQSGMNMYIEGFRESAKTMFIGLLYDIWCIVYKKKRFICAFSYEGRSASSYLFNIALELQTNQRIIEDFGQLFFSDNSEKKSQKKSINEFITENDVKLKAFSMGMSMRGQIFNSKDGILRPDSLCQPKGNSVLTDRGEKDVSEIIIGDIVYSHDGTYNTVMQTRTTNNKEIYSIKIHGYNEEYTFCKGHQIWAKNYKGKFQRRYERLYPVEFINVENLKLGAYVGFPINNKQEQYIRRIKSKRIDSIIRGKQGRIVGGVNYIETDEDITIPGDWYYLLGQFVGDGSIGKGGIVIYCDKNKRQIIENIKGKYEGKVFETIRGGINKLTIQNVKLEKICKQIKQLKNSRKLMPYGFENDLIENQLEFIKGYVESDGFIDYKNNCIRITSVCLPMLRQTQRILLRLGITSYIRDGIDGNDNYEIQGNKCKTQKKYDLYMRNGIEILGYGLKSQSRYKYNNLPVHIEHGYLWSSIESIEKKDNDICYAFSVENTHSYCNHLLANHNCLDDVDVEDSVRNPAIIEKNYRFLKSEVFGGLSSYCQIRVLGNVIMEDGINPRIKKDYTGNKGREIVSQWIYDKEGNITWDRFVNTDIEAEEYNKNIAEAKCRKISLEYKLRELAEISYKQNFLGIAYKEGDKLVKQSNIRTYETSPEKFDYVEIGIDPAFSEKTKTDELSITVIGFKSVENVSYRYVEENLSLVGEEKNEANVLKTVLSLYQQYKVRLIKWESNNGGELYNQLCKNPLRMGGCNVASTSITSTKDKFTRLKEFEGAFQRGEIWFKLGKTEKLIEQLLGFTGDPKNHDDRVDSLTVALTSAGIGFYFSCV